MYDQVNSKMNITPILGCFKECSSSISYLFVSHTLIKYYFRNKLKYLSVSPSTKKNISYGKQ